MGYTTRFKGSLRIEPQPKKELVEVINNFSKTRHDEKDFPGIWCQWIISEGRFLCWNGGEKFYNYVGWLEYLIKNYFVPGNYVLNGKIYFRGERFEDMGVICVEDNYVKLINGLMEISEDEMVIVVSMNPVGKIDMEFIS